MLLSTIADEDFIFTKLKSKGYFGNKFKNIVKSNTLNNQNEGIKLGVKKHKISQNCIYQEPHGERLKAIYLS